VAVTAKTRATRDDEGAEDERTLEDRRGRWNQERRLEIKTSRFGAQPMPSWTPKKKQGPGHSLAHVRIRDKILALSTSEELLQLGQTTGNQFDLFHAVTALRRIAACPDAEMHRKDHRLVAHLSRIQYLLGDESLVKDPRGLSDIAWSCARMAFLHPSLREALSAEARKRIAEFDPQGIVNIVWSYAKLNRNDVAMVSLPCA
jgi:hypothetical protein